MIIYLFRWHTVVTEAINRKVAFFRDDLIPVNPHPLLFIKPCLHSCAGRGSCGCTCECDTTQYGWTWQGPACDCPTDPSDCYDTTMQVRVQLPLSRLITYLVITNKLQMWFLSFLWPNIDWATLQWTGNMCLQEFWLWSMCV